MDFFKFRQIICLDYFFFVSSRYTPSAFFRVREKRGVSMQSVDFALIQKNLQLAINQLFAYFLFLPYIFSRLTIHLYIVMDQLADVEAIRPMYS